MTQIQIKICNRLPLRHFPSGLQKHIQQRHQPHQGKRKGSDTFVHYIFFTFPLPLQHLPVAFFQCRLQLPVFAAHQFFHRKDLFLDQNSTVHLPTALYQIVRLVYQKNIIVLFSLGKKTLQIHIRIKHIIVITDNDIRVQRCIQRHLKRTHLIFFRLL